jgi:hypothetical protein
MLECVERLFGREKREKGTPPSVNYGPVSHPDPDRIRRLIPQLEEIAENLEDDCITIGEAMQSVLNLKCAVHPRQILSTEDYVPISSADFIRRIRITIEQMRNGLSHENEEK